MDNDITINRKILEWGWYSDANTMRVFIHLLLNANWHDGEFHGYPILRGQCVFGYNSFAEDLSISVRNVRTAVKHLKSTKEITQKVTSKFSVITLVKYSDYQPLKNKYEQNVNIEIMNEKTTSYELPTNGLGTQYNPTHNGTSDKQVTSKRQASDSIQEGNNYVVSSNEDTCPNLNSDVPKKLKSKPVFEHETNPYKLAAKLLEMMLVNNPDAQKKTEAQLQSWSHTFDLMIRIDKRKSSQIYDVMFYSQNSEFWRSNILSAAKLREQYDKLKMQMEDGRK